jgi:hypothetical protein
MATLAITEKLSNDLSVITTCLAKLCKDGLEQRNILFSVLLLYATSEKSENSLLYNFFKKKTSTYNLHGCRRHSFALKDLFDNTQYFYIVGNDM